MGFPTIKGAKAGYMPMETFPIEGDTIPTGYNGWLLFLDELNSANLAVQAAAYKIILDRMVGIHHLHKRVAIVAAGNLDTDKAITNALSTALQSRLVHIELQSDMEEWLDWAYDHGIDRRITSYIKYKPGNLYAFNPDHNENTYACNRTWEFANRVLKVTSDHDGDRLPMLAGTISEGVAREFVTFCKIEDSLPKISDIIMAPEVVAVPEEPSILFSLTGSIAEHINETNADSLIKYVKRLGIEFQVVCLKETVKRKKQMMGTPAIQGWISTQAQNLF